MELIETDYLVIGAGAAGMAFTDAVVAESDADVVVVDRRHRPGGHWNDAYPFVRLHQPSAFYGVNSRTLGNDAIDRTGANAGFYERATAAEICDYYSRVLDDLLASDRVRFSGMCDYVGDPSNGHRFVSRLTGEETTVRVRRKVVDATYLETSVPATHSPSFEVDAGVRLRAPNDLVRMDAPATGYTVLGAGKTAMDTCAWLLDNGVPAEAIRWVKPRDAWLLDRGFLQPLELVTSVIEGVSLDLESAAQAENVDDLFRRLEACGQLVRLDPAVEPTMFRGAILSAAEREDLRRIDNVVRLGRVRRLATDRMVLERGAVPTAAGHVHVDCTAVGLRAVPPRPIFEPGRITVQTIRTGFVPFNAALIGFLEVTRGEDADKNRLCPPNSIVNTTVDWLTGTGVSARAEVAWSDQPDVQAWLDRSRLNVSRGVRHHLAEPRMQTAIRRLLEHREAAIANLERLLTRQPDTQPRDWLRSSSGVS